MRRGWSCVAVLLLALLVGVPLGAAASGPRTDVQGMTVSAVPHTTGAQRVRLRITLTYEMQCGYPGAGPLVVTFPSSVMLPKHFAAGSVKLDRKAIAARVKGRTVTMTIAPHKGTLCNTMGPGLLTLVFTHAAKVTNPGRAGSYRFTATHLKHTFSAKLVVQ